MQGMFINTWTQLDGCFSCDRKKLKLFQRLYIYSRTTATKFVLEGEAPPRAISMLRHQSTGHRICDVTSDWEVNFLCYYMLIKGRQSHAWFLQFNLNILCEGKLLDINKGKLLDITNPKKATYYFPMKGIYKRLYAIKTHPNVLIRKKSFNL